MTTSVQTVHWSEVVAFYERLAADRGRAFEPMAELVRRIASSRYANGMFAAISGETVCIGRTPNFTSGNDELRISFDDTEQILTFVHIRRADDRHSWSLSCPTGEWESVFERIVHKRLRWFHEG